MEYFNNVNQTQGSSSKNPLAFKYYNPEEVILGKR